MSDVMSISDVVQLVALCAVIFIPLGYWFVPKLGALVRWLHWRIFLARRFRHVGSLEEFLKESK